MAYIKKISICGKMVFVEKYHSYRNGRKTGRGKNINVTTEEQEKINKRHAARGRVLKACTNFTKGSKFIRLSYFKGDRPDTIDEAHKTFCAFLKKIKRIDKSMKYMGVSELGSRGGIHHHLLVEESFDMSLIDKHWRGAFQKSSVYSEDLSQLASYLTKGECSDIFKEEYIHKEKDKRYTASRNLKKPVVKKQVIKKSDHWSNVPRSVKIDGKMYDYKTGSDWNGFTKDGYEYQHYTLIERRRC